MDNEKRSRTAVGILSIRSAWLPPVLAVMVCGLQMTFWENATAFSGEMLNVLLFAYVIRCQLEYRVEEGRPWLYRAAFAYGLGITNTWAMLAFLPLFLAALAWIKGALVWTKGTGLRCSFNPRFLGGLLLWGSAGLLLYLLLPVTQSWGDSAVLHRRRVRIDLGVVHMDGGYSINGYLEKPVYDYTVSMGIYVFEPAVMKFIPFNSYLDFPDLVLKMISAGEKVTGYPFDGYWMDLGRPDDYGQAVEDFASMRKQFLPDEL